jgi:hypothetical protein
MPDKHSAMKDQCYGHEKNTHGLKMREGGEGRRRGARSPVTRRPHSASVRPEFFRAPRVRDWSP